MLLVLLHTIATILFNNSIYILYIHARSIIILLLFSGGEYKTQIKHWRFTFNCLIRRSTEKEENEVDFTSYS